MGAKGKPARPVAAARSPRRKSLPPSASPTAHVPSTRARPRPPTRVPSQTTARVPIVALGASAGGLQAFEEFFSNVPPDSGLSYVVISHQDPTRSTLLPELLAKSATIPVVVVSDGMVPQPNQIHVAPPGKNVALLNGALQLMDAEVHRGAPLGIDYLFRSLAEDQRGNAVCIVLSGNGTDGTLGLRAIKAESGMAIVQEPSTAGFTGMPESAVATGLADYVLPPAQMPAQLVKYARSPHVAHGDAEPDRPFEQVLRKVLILVRGRTGHDFSAYKPTTIRRRVERRMGVHQIADAQHYVQYLERNPQELDILFREMLISVTTFFRDPDAFDALRQVALPKLLTAKPADHALRVWVPGCATGEEAYSVAILIRECLDELDRPVNFQVFGTDLDSHAIDVARNGLYPDGIAVDVGPRRLERFFTREDHSYRVNKDIRQALVFASQNLISDPPFTKLDLITCRNLLIYLNPDLQQRLIPLFHYALRPHGLLMLGSSESIGAFTELFAPVDKKWKVYVRQGAASALPDLIAPPGTESERETGGLPSRRVAEAPHIQSTADAVAQLLTTQFAPPCVVVNERGDIHHVHGRTGKYLEPAAGRPSLNVLKMAREGLQLELSAALRRAAKPHAATVRANVRVTTDGGPELVRLTVERIAAPESLKSLFLVAFEAVPEPPPDAPATRALPGSKAAHARSAAAEREIQHLKETLQSTVEESDTTNEELKSMNEELQSTNEELQSANEELETSKEEMQSLNEELHTVNAELQSKVDELSQSTDDMANLLNCTGIATVFLDTELRIQRFTKQARQLIKLIDTDVGRSVNDLVSTLRFENLGADATEVLETLAPREKKVQTADGRGYLMRIMPYRTSRNVIEGLVVTFVDLGDVAAVEAAERAAQATRAFAEGLAETMREPFLVLDARLRVVRANRGFYQTFQVDPADTDGRLIYELGNRQWDIPALRRLLEQVLPKQAVLTDFEVRHDFAVIGPRRMLLNARRLSRGDGAPDLIFLAIEDVTEKSP